MDTTDLAPLLRRLAEALDRLAPALPPGASLDDGDAFIWSAGASGLRAVASVNRLDLGLLQGIGQQAATLLANTERFAAGLPANNALLWGARGTGKSSLVKAIHGHINAERPGALALVEIHREDIASLPELLLRLKASPRRCLLFCDDLSFDGRDASYKSLKAVLEGGIEGRPENVVFYATSNRRHLMPREMIDNERATAVNRGEAIEEKISLSDRFGLWLGFHSFDQATYLAIVHAYVRHYRLPVADDVVAADAIAWAQARGARSGRVAWQFIQDLAGRLGCEMSGGNAPHA